MNKLLVGLLVLGLSFSSLASMDPLVVQCMVDFDEATAPIISKAKRILISESGVYQDDMGTVFWPSDNDYSERLAKFEGKIFLKINIGMRVAVDFTKLGSVKKLIDDCLLYTEPFTLGKPGTKISYILNDVDRQNNNRFLCKDFVRRVVQCEVQPHD